MKTKAIVAGVVVLMALLFLAILLIVSRKPPLDITVRHFKSVQSPNITKMTFEIKNRTATRYIYLPYEVQVRNGNAWTNFQASGFHSSPVTAVGPTCLVYYTVDVTNLPAKSVARFSIHPQKMLLGLSSLFRRVELQWESSGRNVPSLNPYDKNTVLGRPTDVTSDEFVAP